eukprot:s118_g31.t1
MQTTCHAYFSVDHPAGSPRTAHLSRPSGAAAVSLWLMSHGESLWLTSHGDTPYSNQLQGGTTKPLFMAKALCAAFVVSAKIDPRSLDTFSMLK